MKIKAQDCVLTLVTAISTVAHAQPTPTLQANIKSERAGSYYTADKVPGDVKNGIEQLGRIYRLIQKYRERHNGSHASQLGATTGRLNNSDIIDPIQIPRPLPIVTDVLNNFKAYGFDNKHSALTALLNPDNRYDDLFYIRLDPDRNGAPVILGSRPDGTPIGAPKPTGTFDVLSFSKTYYHANSADSVVERFVANPVGFYLTLRDDSSIARVPYDQVFLVYFAVAGRPGLGTIPAFPNQAGVPFNSMTYEEHQTSVVGRSAPPIGTRVSQDTLLPITDNGAFESLVQVSRLLNKPLERSDIWQSFDAAQEEFNLADVQAGGAKLNLALESKKLALDELAKLNAPAIFLTSDDKRIVVLSNLDDKEAIVVDRGLTRIVPRELLARRYGGEVLLAKSTPGEAAKVLCDDAVRVLDVANTADEIAQTASIRNGGTQPLSLQIERPIPGATQAELSSDTIAPGQTATLNLKLKWRNVLKSPTQNVFVFLKTNDPKRPRLQLGFQLKTTAATIVAPLPTAAETAALPRAEADPTVIIGRAIPNVQIGQAAPEFTATDMNGKVWKLSELKGKKNLLLTFFPKCFTGGCANHLSSLRDQQAEFDAADTQILAVSVDAADGERGQKAFAQQWQLQFPMIPDTQRTLARLFGAAQNDKQLAARMSILIDKQGIIRWVDSNVQVRTHGMDVLAQMRELKLIP